jgi:hypothetical protein
MPGEVAGHDFARRPRARGTATRGAVRKGLPASYRPDAPGGRPPRRGGRRVAARTAVRVPRCVRRRRGPAGRPALQVPPLRRARRASARHLRGEGRGHAPAPRRTAAQSGPGGVVASGGCCDGQGAAASMRPAPAHRQRLGPVQCAGRLLPGPPPPRPWPFRLPSASAGRCKVRLCPPAATAAACSPPRRDAGRRRRCCNRCPALSRRLPACRPPPAARCPLPAARRPPPAARCARSQLPAAPARRAPPRRRPCRRPPPVNARGCSSR